MELTYSADRSDYQDDVYRVRALHTRDDFFLVENRQTGAGWNMALADSVHDGLLVWHVLETRLLGEVEGIDPFYDLIDLVEADNLSDLSTYDGDPFPGSTGGTELSDFTSPNSRLWMGPNFDPNMPGDNSSVRVSNIRGSGSKVMADLSPYWAGTIEMDDSWSGSVRVGGDLTIGPDVTLTITSGTEVRFLADSESRSELIVLGTLNASAGNITFRSSNDADDASNDDWYGIRVAATGVADLSGATIRDGSRCLESEDGGTLALTNTTLTNCGVTVGLVGAPPQVGRGLTAVLDDPDGGTLERAFFQWHWRGSDTDPWATLTPSSRLVRYPALGTYTPLGRDMGRQLRVMVRYRARDSKGTLYNYAQSGPTAAVVAGVPGKPGDFSAAAGHEQMELTWSSAPDHESALTGYEFRQSADGGLSWDPDWEAISGSNAQTVSHTVSEGLTNGTRYLFEVRAVNGVGKGVAAQVSATPGSGPGVPPAPTSGLTASPGATGMDVAWGAVSATPAVTGYRLRSQWAVVGTQAWSSYDTVATPGATTLRYTHRDAGDVVVKHRLRYQLQAVNDSGAGAWSSAFPARGVVPPPSGPPRLDSMAVDGRSVTMTWQCPSRGWCQPQTGSTVAPMTLEAQEKSGGAAWGSDWEAVTTAELTSIRHLVSGLDGGSVQQFRTRAVNSEGEPGGVSSAAAVFPLRARGGDGRAALSWDSPGYAGVTWQYRSKAGAGAWTDWQPVPGSGASTTSTTVSSLTNGVGYRLQVRALSGTQVRGVSFLSSVTPARRLTISGRDSVSFAENGTDTVATYQALDTLGAAVSPVTWSLEGVDADTLEIDASGRLRFETPPDFEAPGDRARAATATEAAVAAGDNVYQVRLKARNTSTPPDSTTHDVTVTVTDVNEPGRVTLSPTRPRANQALTATLRDPDGVEENPQWVWSRSSQTYGRQAAAGDPLPTLREQTVYPHPVLVGRKVMAKVTYRDRHGAGQRAESAWSDPVIDVPSVPLNLRLTPGHRKVHLTWEPPLKTHGSALTGYGYRQDGGGETTKDTVEVTTSHTVDGLTNGTAYTFKVWAINGAGRGKGTDFVGPVVPRPDTVSFDASSYVATEDGDTATVKVHMPRAPVAAVTVKVTVRPGPGTEAGDFETVDLAADSTVSFTASAATDSFRIVARPDADSDDESVLVGFKDLPDGIAPGAHPTATVDLLDVTLQVVGPDSVKVEENRRTVAAYRATDPSDAPVAPVTWSLSGDDAPRFRVDGNTLEFVEESRPDYEQPVDDGGNNVYHVDLMAEYGGVYSSTPFSVVVTVTDVDEPGKVTMSPSRPHVGDQATATLTDPDGVTGPTWSWRTAESRSRSPSTQSYRYTVPSSAAGQILRASVSYTDAHGRQSADTTSTGPVLSTNRAPVISGSAAVTVDEDSTRVGTYAATDADGDRVTWSRAGADSSAFTIGSTGALRFGAAPDYEAPADADGDSVYSVEVVATDPGKAADTLAVSVSVRNVDEPGVVSFSPNPPKVGQTVTATVEDPDGGVRNHRNWHWSHADAPRGARDTFSPTGQYTPTAQNVDYRLRVTVTYDDAHGSDKSAGGNSGPVPPPPSCVLTLTASESSPVSYAENGTGAVATYTVTRSSGCHPTRALSWTLSGADASAFEAWTGSGSSQTLEFNDPPDHETQSSYRVTAGVTDGSASTSREVTVNVTDVNEPPAISGPASKSVPENTTEVATYTATDPEDDSVTWELVTGSGTFRIGRDSGVLAFQSAKDYEALTSYTYTVKIRATDDGSPEEDTTRTVTVTVTNVNEPGTVTLDPTAPQTCAHTTGTLRDEDGGINTESSDSPPGFPYGWQWIPQTSSRSPTATSTTQSYLPSNSLVGQTIRVTLQYGDNASSRNTATTTSGVVRANAPRSIPRFTATGGQRRADLAWTAPNDCGASVTYTYKYRLSGGSWTTRTTTSTSAGITGLAAGAYEFELTAGNRAGNSATETATATVTGAPGTLTLAPDPPSTCAHLEATLTDADGGINTESSDSPPGFPYGWQWIPQTSSRSPATTSTTQSYLPSNSLVGQTIRVTVQYGDNASSRNTATRTTAAVQVNTPRAIPGFSATGGRGRVDLAWTAPNDCGASVTYTYKYRLSGSTTWTTRTTTSTSAGITGLAAGAYEFELTAGNSAGTSGTETATATVTPVNRPPVVTGPANPTVPEDTTPVGTYTGTDPDGDRLTWTTGSGFSVSPTSGPSGESTTLAFDEAPNYEVDATSQSTTVTATDPHGASHSYAVTIAVGNEDDPGEVTVTPDSPRVGETVNAVLTDEDGGVRGDPWSWSSEAAAARGQDGPGDNVPRVGNTWTAWKGAVGRHLVASRTYSDNHGSGKSASGRTQGVVRANKPKAPPDFDAVRGDGQVRLSWGAADDQGAAIDYYQWRRNGTTWQSTGTSRTKTVTGLDNGTPYDFQVRAHNSEGFGPPSSDSATPAGKPDAPGGFSHGRSSANSVTVSWDEPEDNGSAITTYYWSKRGTFFWDSETTVTSTEFTDSSSPNSEQHRYRVRARNSVGMGPYGYYTVPAEEQRSARFKPVAAFADSTGFGVLTAPNPFNSQTLIHLALPEEGEVTLSVHSLTGQTVARLYENTPLEAGLHALAWPGVDDRGRPVGSGIYLYRLIAGDRIHLGKLALIR